jgi:TolB-like protein
MVRTRGSLSALREPANTGLPASRVMLAVLPFQNLTGDASQEYFSDGLTKEMLTQLGNFDPEHRA